jgi:hypothetical protein
MRALFREFYPSLALVRTGWEGLRGGSSPWQLRDKGSPCLLFPPPALRGLHKALCTNQAVLRVEREIMGKQIQLLYLGKIAFVNIASLIII